MASAAADAFYAVSSAIVILATGVFLLRRGSKNNEQRFILWVALLSFLSIVAFLVVYRSVLISASARIRRANIPISLPDACWTRLPFLFSYCSFTRLIGSVFGRF